MYLVRTNLDSFVMLFLHLCGLIVQLGCMEFFIIIPEPQYGSLMHWDAILVLISFVCVFEMKCKSNFVSRVDFEFGKANQWLILFSIRVN
uniref:Uncharacterized protein n=1 Tax=Rhizophora mucronata TaxID=61149 RepID=A0A2P2MAC1_RHIMU